MQALSELVGLQLETILTLHHESTNLWPDLLAIFISWFWADLREEKANAYPFFSLSSGVAHLPVLEKTVSAVSGPLLLSRLANSHPS